MEVGFATFTASDALITASVVVISAALLT